MLKIGDKAPAFSLPDQNGSIISSADLKGQPYVIYFYPKDSTSGCTKQAQAYSENLDKFTLPAIRFLECPRIPLYPIKSLRRSMTLPLPSLRMWIRKLSAALMSGRRKRTTVRSPWVLSVPAMWWMARERLLSQIPIPRQRMIAGK